MIRTTDEISAGCCRLKRATKRVRGLVEAKVGGEVGLKAGAKVGSSPLSTGLPPLGSKLEALDPVQDQRPQHLTYSSAFVAHLHTFVEASVAEAQVIHYSSPPPPPGGLACLLRRATSVVAV